ncbi:hypothetical protein [Carnobacterium jeotgali]|uniref:hypothetical protein n=1 Tax=Carnobacterium jeotgali TaxID=545534 RepID=UPI00049327F0|nr:hypothetical protein [Carnobacterium jeotgali]
MTKTFAVYKGYEILAEGTAKQCAEKLNVKVETIWYYKSATYQKKGSGKNRRIAIELEEAK